MGAFDNYEPPQGKQPTGVAFDNYKSSGNGGGLMDTLSSWNNTAADALHGGTGFIARDAARVGLGIPDLLAQGIRMAHDKITGQQTSLPLMSDSAIHAMGADLPADASPAMRTADYIAPWVTPGPGVLGRIGEAPGIINKIGEAGRYVAGGVADSYLSNEAADLANKAGLGEAGTTIASLLGASARPAASFGGGKILQATKAAPDAQAIYDAGMRQGTQPTYGAMVGGSQAEKLLNKTPLIGYPTAEAVNANEEAVKAGVNKGLGGLSTDPNPPSIEAPADAASLGSRILDTARQNNATRSAALGDEQGRIESQIDEATPVPGSASIQALQDIATGKTVGSAEAKAGAEARLAQIQRSINELHPVKTLQGQEASDWVTANRGSMSQSELSDAFSKIISGQGITPPQPQELTFGALRDISGDLGKSMDNSPALPRRYKAPVYGTMRGELQGAADAAGVGPDFAAANTATKNFMQTEQPYLERVGGTPISDTDEFAGGMNEGQASNVVANAMRKNTSELGRMHDYLGQDTTRSALADAISGYGQQQAGGAPTAFRPDVYGRNFFSKTSGDTRGYMGAVAPEATQDLTDAAMVGRSLRARPDAFNLTGSLIGAPIAVDLLKYLNSSPEMVAMTAAAVPAVFGAPQSPSVIRALAGRTDIPALLQQYALRAGVTPSSTSTAAPWQ